MGVVILLQLHER